ncbi:MAG TPA: thioredoxin family protein [Flavitalea sp.]|nr:thioredoxin family protein [Flavitalea sp.]
MKLFLIALLALGSINSSSDWLLDFEKAKQVAENDHKYILLNFSGSDWCGPCIQLHKEIFDNEIFAQFAKEHLVLVNADFPRLKKHALSREQQKKNDNLAETYNKKGVFPLTVLLDAEGRSLYSWEGKPELSADQFTLQIQNLTHARN